MSREGLLAGANILCTDHQSKVPVMGHSIKANCCPVSSQSRHSLPVAQGLAVCSTDTLCAQAEIAAELRMGTGYVTKAGLQEKHQEGSV